MNRTHRFVLASVLIVLIALRVGAATLPELPRVYMQTGFALPLNAVVYKPLTSADFQTALNACKFGDIIELQAGTVYRGPFTLPNKTSGTGWVYIISSELSSLPSPCTRVSPSDAVNMPVITVGSGAGGAIGTAPGAHHFRFVGIEFKPVTGNFVYNIVQIGNGEKTEATQPNNIIIDRCYIHGDPVAGTRRGILFNGASLAVIDSYISDCKEDGADSQALASYSGTGPIKIANNYLEGAGENVIFGGADPSIPNAVPSDIEIRCNRFFKPLHWKQEAWDIKNLLEFKNAQRVLVEGNTFENNWPNAQSGFCLLLTPRNQNNTAPWSVVQDITIRRNTFTNIAQGVNISGYDSPNKSERTSRVLIKDNVFKLVQMPSSDGRLFQVLNGSTDVVIDHNTGFCPNAYLVSDGSPKTDNFVFSNNIVTHGNYGFIGSGTAYANTTLAMYFNPNWFVSNNVDIGGSSKNYPDGNFFPATIGAVGFVDTASDNYRLAAGSFYKNGAYDGVDIGADIDSIESAMIYKCDEPMSEVRMEPELMVTVLSPNPADRYLNVVTNASGSTLVKIWVTNYLGSEILSLVSSHDIETINTSMLPSGFYQLHLQTGGMLRTGTFVVRH
jgi:hypothetical protein